MKNKCRFLLILTVAIVSSFYMIDSTVAMAEEQTIEYGAEPKESTQPDAEPKESTQPDAEPKESAQPDAEPKESTQPNMEPKESIQPNLDSKPEQIVEPAATLDAEQIMEPAAILDAEQIMKPAAEPDTEQIVSTGPELIEWLESHKSTGGTVKLAGNVTLDGNYEFFPNGANGPFIFVDTDKYTIIVTGEIYLLSDEHLTFSGCPEDKGIFYVAPKGMLSMGGVIVKSGQGALWQEEGAGLEVSSCPVSGDIHYAATPFVTYYKDSICAVVEKGQTVNDVLPSQISCTVNRQGKLSHNELVPVSWNQEGSEKQQEERRRFDLSGSFLYAASAQPPLCTVVYNDYPLTFTEVEASVNGSGYLFRGQFTVPEESLPFTVVSEYSFDGENWFPDEEKLITNANASFSINCKYGRAADSNIYIRLKWDDNGTTYFSNVLCYSIDNLAYAEDIGGSRGGGTSIINPPDEPLQSTDDVSSVGGEVNPDADSDTHSDNAGLEDSSATNQRESGSSDEGAEQSLYTESSNSDNAQQHTEVSDTKQEQPSNAGLSNHNQEQAFYAESKADDIAGSIYNDADVIEKREETTIVMPVYEDNGEAFSQISERTLQSDRRRKAGIFIAAGAVILSAAAGIACYYVRSRSGTKR